MKNLQKFANLNHHESLISTYAQTGCLNLSTEDQHICIAVTGVIKLCTGKILFVLRRENMELPLCSS